MFMKHDVWRKLRNKCIIRMIKPTRMRWARNVTHIVELRNSYNSFIGKPDVKTPVERPRRRWEGLARDSGELLVGRW
jgi:hypothetical protein